MTSVALLLLVLTTTSEALAHQTPITSWAQASAGLTENEKIQKLISFVESLQGATFIRNGSEHNPKDAAAHLQSKFDKHHAKIKTASDFIEQLATKSSMSGEYYQIRMADGTTTEAYKVLNQELARIEKANRPE